MINHVIFFLSWVELKTFVNSTNNTGLWELIGLESLCRSPHDLHEETVKELANLHVASNALIYNNTFVQAIFS